MGLNISCDKEWMEMQKAIWKKIEEELNDLLKRVMRKDACPEDQGKNLPNPQKKDSNQAKLSGNAL